MQHVQTPGEPPPLQKTASRVRRDDDGPMEMQGEQKRDGALAGAQVADDPQQERTMHIRVRGSFDTGKELGDDTHHGFTSEQIIPQYVAMRQSQPAAQEN